ncbi:MAG TPA: DUF2937 family protein [Spirochaetota bacterium]|nr:DUF2937 family protein [Spirochaetota bacterium]
MLDKNALLLAPVRFVDSLLDRICAVLGALVFAQFPQYLAQYIQRLGGHVDEAARNMEKYREIAKDVGKSLYQYSQHLLNSKDPAVFKTGQKIAGDLERYNQLADALKELQNAPAYKKFFIFVRHVDFDIARGAWESFTPGLPVTLEGAAYAAVGIVVGMILYFCLSRLVIILVKKIAGRKQKPVINPMG